MTQKRDDTKLLIARQIAINDECVWVRLPPNTRVKYLVLAENILATVERKMTSWSWQ